MPRIRRGGYVFLCRLADHAPRHVHVYDDRRCIMKWDLRRGQVLSGHAPARVVRLLLELVREGRL